MLILLQLSLCSSRCSKEEGSVAASAAEEGSALSWMRRLASVVMGLVHMRTGTRLR